MAVRIEVKQPFVDNGQSKGYPDYSCNEECWDPSCSPQDYPCSHGNGHTFFSDRGFICLSTAPLTASGISVAAAYAGYTGLALGLGIAGVAVSGVVLISVCYGKRVWKIPPTQAVAKTKNCCFDCMTGTYVFTAAANAAALVFNKIWNS